MTSQLIGGGGEVGKETDKEKEAEQDREKETPKLMYDVNSNPPADIIIIYAIQVIEYNMNVCFPIFFPIHKGKGNTYVVLELSPE